MIAPWRVFDSLYRHRSLLWVMIKRDVLGRYKGSALGLLWSLFNPILTLIVYTLVFGGILGVSASKGAGGNRDFAIFIFSGMIVYLLFAECVNRSSTLILSHANYVKRVVFPLEILPWVVLGSATFHFLVSMGVLLGASLILRHWIPWTFIFVPLPLICLGMLIMGITWFLSSLGVYLRDMAPTVIVITNLLLFLSPVFYDINDPSMSPRRRFYLELNPLTFLLGQMRRIAYDQQLPNFLGLLIYFVCATLFAWIGLIWFQKTRKGFADVI